MSQSKFEALMSELPKVLGAWDKDECVRLWDAPTLDVLVEEKKAGRKVIVFLGGSGPCALVEGLVEALSPHWLAMKLQDGRSVLVAREQIRSITSAPPKR